MHEEPKSLLKQAVQQCLPELNALAVTHVSPYLVWKKTGEGKWHGAYEQRSELNSLFMAADSMIREAGKQFGESFLKHHPTYCGKVGFPHFVLMDFGQQSEHIFRSGLSYLWEKHGTFELNEDSLTDFVNDFAEFVDRPNVRFFFRCQLLNFNATDDRIDLPEGLRIRRMSEEEVSEHHGGSLVFWRITRSSAFGMHEFCIEGETEIPKVFGNYNENEPSTRDGVKRRLDKAILCLRTFKAGQVGYDYIHFYAAGFCPLPLGATGYGDLYVPPGSYQLHADELGTLTEHARLMFDVSEAAMEMACSRLADAETRTQPQDRLVDAVIGMEALLLAGLAKDARQGELKFRFALHYSTLFDMPEERYRGFRLAKGLYDLRSIVAHGSSLGNGSFPVGEEKLSLPDAAKKACETLRHVVLHFLPTTKHAPYKKHEFWERKYFGLTLPGS